MKTSAVSLIIIYFDYINKEHKKKQIVQITADCIWIKNFNHAKKVSDIFIDSKIPLEKRDLWPIVVDSSDKIIWIPNIKKSKYNRLKNEKCDIIFKCY